MGELIPRMVWNSAAFPFVEAADFIGFYDFLVKVIEVENGFEIRCTGNST